jgi:hypothetical protein
MTCLRLFVDKQEGLLTFLLLQNSFVVPQKPNSKQQTFKGQDETSAHLAPKPGLQYALLSQPAKQSSPQSVE